MATGKADIGKMSASGAKLFAMINMGMAAGPDLLRVGERMPVTANLIISNPYGIPKPLYLSGGRLDYFMPLVGPSLGTARSGRIHELCRRDVRDADLDPLGGAGNRSFRAPCSAVVPRARARQPRAGRAAPAARAQERDQTFAPRRHTRSRLMRDTALRTFAVGGACPNPATRLSIRGRLLIAFYRHVFKPRFPEAHRARPGTRIDRQTRPAAGRWACRLRARRRERKRRRGRVGDDRRSARASRTILYLHGGGFMFRTPRTHARLAARLCAALDARAFIPRYRLAPEHPLPAAHEDCFAAYRWLLAEGHDPRRHRRDGRFRRRFPDHRGVTAHSRRRASAAVLRRGVLLRRGPGEKFSGSTPTPPAATR